MWNFVVLPFPSTHQTLKLADWEAKIHQ